jgi:hypothetical protein
MVFIMMAPSLVLVRGMVEPAAQQSKQKNSQRGNRIPQNKNNPATWAILRHRQGAEMLEWDKALDWP